MKDVNSSIYFFTTDDEIQAAVKITLQFGQHGTEHYVVFDLYNADPATATPIASSTHNLASQAIVTMSGGGISLNGGLTPYLPGVTAELKLKAPNYEATLHGIIGVFNGDGPKQSAPFKFGHYLTLPQEKHTAILGLEWNDKRSDYDARWGFNGQTGTVPLTDGQGSISYNENGIGIEGTFSRDLVYNFDGHFCLPDVIQLGFKNAAFAGNLGPNYNHFP